MKTSYDIIKKMIRTEKGSMLLLQNKYLFEVNKRSNKIEVKKAVEEIYKVEKSLLSQIDNIDSNDEFPLSAASSPVKRGRKPNHQRIS